MSHANNDTRGRLGDVQLDQADRFADALHVGTYCNDPSPYHADLVRNLTTEVRALRETVKRLNRRATQAEAALLPKAAVVGERSIGRALANAAAATWQRHCRDAVMLARDILDQYEDAAPYVSDYFREKWGHTDADIDKFRVRLRLLDEVIS